MLPPTRLSAEPIDSSTIAPFAAQNQFTQRMAGDAKPAIGAAAVLYSAARE